MPWVVLQFVIVVFPDHTDFLCSSKFDVILMNKRESWLLYVKWRPGVF